MLDLYEIKPRIWIVTYQRNQYASILTIFVGRYRRAHRFFNQQLKNWG